jgi:hypothetical protein
MNMRLRGSWLILFSPLFFSWSKKVTDDQITALLKMVRWSVREAREKAKDLPGTFYGPVVLVLKLLDIKLTELLKERGDE